MYFAYENMQIKHKTWNDVDFHKAQKMHIHAWSETQKKLSSKLPALFLHLNICSGSKIFTLSSAAQQEVSVLCVLGVGEGWISDSFRCKIAFWKIAFCYFPTCHLLINTCSVGFFFFHNWAHFPKVIIVYLHFRQLTFSAPRLLYALVRSS